MTRRLSTMILVLSATLSALLCPPAPAQTAREILDRARELDDTTRRWTDRTQRMKLSIYDRSGAERQRELQAFSKRYPDGEERAISFFLAPREVQGVAFLQWLRRADREQQWLYLPETKRTRQIAARLRDESFMGTDFTFRDLEIIVDFQRWTEQEAPAKLLGEEQVDGVVADVIELRPRFEGAPYARLVLLLERAKLVPRKLDFYDTGGTLLKTLTLNDVRDIGSIPTAHRFEMKSASRGSRTLVELEEVTYDSGLADELFTQRQLQRGAP